MSPLKIGFIGVGKICKVNHIPAFKELSSEVDLIALYDDSQDAAKAVRQEFLPEAQVYSSLESFLTSGLDAVVISTPNHVHYPLTMACLKAGLHVLVEKPMAGSLAEDDEMIGLAKEKNRILQVNQSLRFHPLYLFLRQQIDEGKIGKPLHIRCIRTSAQSPDQAWSQGARWFLSKEARGGVIMDIAVHMADLMTWYFGDVSSLSAVHKIKGTHCEVPDHLSALFDFKNGATGVLELGWHFPRNVNLLEIYGDKGTLRLGVKQGEVEFAEGTEDFVSLNPPDSSSPNAQASFVRAIRDPHHAVAPPSVGRNALALCCALEEAGETGLPQKPDLYNL